jgi:methionyl-tRNA formyltransferase
MTENNKNTPVDGPAHPDLQYTDSGNRSGDGARIIFMGTPEFAEASLAALLAAGLNVVAVITAADKPAGRGMKMTQSRVKSFALANGLTVLTPEKLKNPEFIEELRSYRADLQVVVAFRMLPEVVWNMPPMGTLNLHGSLLPQYRGAAPINWAIINGEKETGVTTFRLKHEIDTGDILEQLRLPIGDDETAGQLHDRMMHAGAGLLVHTVQGLISGELKEVPQESNADLKHAPKIFTETCRIDWKKPVQDVYNLIRGLSPYPGAFTTFQEKLLKVYSAEKVAGAAMDEPGSFDTDGKTFLHFAAADGLISLKEIQLEGKKRMAVGDFLRGLR